MKTLMRQQSNDTKYMNRTPQSFIFNWNDKMY